MELPVQELLSRLGAGESIAAVSGAAGLSRGEFEAWWRRETKSRVPSVEGERRAAVGASVRIDRDEWGIPHVYAPNDDDLFFGFGYATAQDRLFQLDYLRRRALGRLSEVLGPDGFELDLIARTVGLHLTPEREWQALPDETRQLIEAFTRGVNQVIDECGARLPIEFDLLNYRPSPWMPQDCLAIAGEFRWYLTGRFPVIVIPELAKRTLGKGPLYEAFLTAEADGECILPAGSYASVAGRQGAVGQTVGDPEASAGSNNWVVSGSRTMTGKPLLASDPHIAFAAVSCWHEVHLCGGSFNVAGMAYAGVPAVMFGRNRRVAWGCTNNICSIRDLYQEKTDAAHPGCFEYDGQWEPARDRIEVIEIRGREAVCKTVISSRHGPIVNEILPAVAQGAGPVSLRWLGAEPCGWVPALLGMNRAANAADFREATRPWLVPTFCVVYADVEGRIGYQCTGRIPIRGLAERGYRPGWSSAHQWQGLISFDEMPACVDPPRGWLATANNRVAADDYPQPLAGTWVSGYRAVRVRQMLESQPQLTRAHFAHMHQDVVSLRAAACVPRLMDVLKHTEDIRFRRALNFLAAWDFRMEPDRVAAAIFSVFFSHWCEAVAAQRFDRETAAFVAGAIGGLAGDLLEHDRAGWFFSPETREETVSQAFSSALDWLARQFGDDMLNWGWGRMHTVQQRHFLSGRGELAELLDRGGVPVRGDGLTVCNTGTDPNWGASLGAGYRMIADLADDQAALWAIDAGGESGHPGSPHYDDQLEPWLTAQYHCLTLPATPPAANSRSLTILPHA